MVTCTRSKSTSKDKIADCESRFLRIDGADNKDEKADISAQHTCFMIVNPGPDQSESDSNPPAVGQEESSQD